MTSSKVIIQHDVEDFEHWSPPDVMERRKEESVDPKDTGALLTAEELEQLQKAAYDEGFEQGRKAGFEYGHQEALTETRAKMDKAAREFERLLQSFATPLQNLDDQVEHELIELVIAMVRQLVRREVRTDPEQIIGIVRESLSILPVASRGIRVVLHPEDAVLVRNVYELSEHELGWNIVEDPVLARGGCRVLTDTSQVDATLESRLASLIAPLLGDEREPGEG